MDDDDSLFLLDEEVPEEESHPARDASPITIDRSFSSSRFRNSSSNNNSGSNGNGNANDTNDVANNDGNNGRSQARPPKGGERTIPIQRGTFYGRSGRERGGRGHDTGRVSMYGKSCPAAPVVGSLPAPSHMDDMIPALELPPNSLQELSLMESSQANNTSGATTTSTSGQKGVFSALQQPSVRFVHFDSKQRARKKRHNAFESMPSSCPATMQHNFMGGRARWRRNNAGEDVQEHDEQFRHRQRQHTQEYLRHDSSRQQRASTGSNATTLSSSTTTDRRGQPGREQGGTTTTTAPTTQSEPVPMKDYSLPRGGRGEDEEGHEEMGHRSSKLSTSQTAMSILQSESFQEHQRKRMMNATQN